MSAVPSWHTTGLVVRAAVLTLAGVIDDDIYESGGEWADSPIKPPLPKTPENFDTASGLPVDGAIFGRIPAIDEISEAIPPWVCVWCEDPPSSPDENLDSDSRLVEVVLQIHYRVGLDGETYDLSVAEEVLRQTAEAGARLMASLLARNLPLKARELDSTGAWGIVHARATEPQAGYQIALDDEAGQETLVCDARSTVVVIQHRSYATTTSGV